MNEHTYAFNCGETIRGLSHTLDVEIVLVSVGTPGAGSPCLR